MAAGYQIRGDARKMSLAVAAVTARGETDR